MPVVNAPFRIYWAYNPMRINEIVSSPNPITRSMFPAGAAGDYTYAQAISHLSAQVLSGRAAQDLPLHGGDNVLGEISVRRFRPQCVLGLLASVWAVAQGTQQPQTAPAPSPQVQMMNYFAGDWKLSGTTKISPSAPGAPFTSTEHGEWVPGGFFLEIIR